MRFAGHLAGGYIVSRAVTAQWKLSRAQQRELIGLGTLAGISPDLDILFHLVRTRSLEFGPDFQHHRWITHKFPFYWVPLCALWLYGRTRRSLRITRATLVMLGSSTGHLLQDMIGTGDGVMWAWPFSTRMDGFSLLNVHGREWAKVYREHPIAWIERYIILIAAVVLIRDIISLQAEMDDN